MPAQHLGPMLWRSRCPYRNGILLWFKIDDFDTAVAHAVEVKADIFRPHHRNPRSGYGGPHDPDGCAAVVASLDGSAR
jgi:hypothetical protein